MKGGPSYRRCCALAMAIACCAVFILVGQSHAQPEIIEKFLPRSHTFQGTTLVYRLFIPQGYTSAKRYPVVLALHSNGLQGSDNVSQMLYTRFATSWADPVSQSKYPCFVVVPQCRAGYWWTDGPALTPDLATANNILDSLGREFSIDTTRMYVTGLSMGGFATWILTTVMPERFAAAVPVSAGWWGAVAFRIGDIPIWAFQGAADDIVPVETVRDIIDGLRRRGRAPVYTNCQNGDCTGLTNNAIEAHVNSHADLFYSEFQNGTHYLDSSQSFDYPLLHRWVFDKIRPTQGLVTLNGMSSYRVLRGPEPITWTSPNPSDSVQIRFSPDAGFTWQLVAASLPNTGSYLWNTQNVNDCAFGVVKVFLKNSQGQTYGYDQSAYFALDNGTSGKPLAKILNPDSFFGVPIDTNMVALQYLAGSSKPGQVTVRFYYSADGGVSSTQIDSYTAERDTTSRTRTLDVAALPNSENAVLRIDVSDGADVSSDTTTPLHPFMKRTPRGSGPIPSKVTGVGSGSVSVHIVDASKLTGDLYRVSFHSVPSLGRTYDVLNETEGIKVVQNATELDGTTEGPLFDGMRLVIRDYPQTKVNQDSTRWEVGVPTLLNVQIVVPSLNIGGQVINGYPYPADYRISFFDHIVDTSSGAIFGTGRIPVNFSVWNVTENRRSDLVFIDSDNNQQMSSFDEIFILEPDSQGASRVTWDLLFVAVLNATSVPSPGDQFVLRTLKPFQPGDTFSFRGVLSSVTVTSLPESPKLFQNYPNPFNPTTVIRFEIPSTRLGFGMWDLGFVSLKVYDLLGREVATVVNERKGPGEYVTTWNASGTASGVYFYRLTTGAFVETRKMILVR